MSLIRFGVVGSNSITDVFLSAVKAAPNVVLSAVYSRTQARAQEYAAKHNCSLFFTDLKEMAKSKEIDCVYIASPTSLHAEQSVLFLSHKKHVLCEKPVCSNSKELAIVLECAQKNNVVFLEAMRPVFVPNFAHLKQHLSLVQPVRSVLGVFCQLSSRWPALLNGERPNAFLPEFSNGALMDIGCYCVHVMVALFGAPSSIQYFPVMLETGVDGSGSLVLTYDESSSSNSENSSRRNKTVITLLFSKQSQAFVCSEIQGEKGTLSIGNLGDFAEISMQKKGGQQESLGEKQDDNTLVYELATFCRLVRKEDEEKLQATHNEWSKETMRVLDQARKSANFVFPADSADLSEITRLATSDETQQAQSNASQEQKKAKLS